MVTVNAEKHIWENRIEIFRICKDTELAWKAFHLALRQMRAHQLLIWTLIKLSPLKGWDTAQEIQCSSDYKSTDRPVWKM